MINYKHADMYKKGSIDKQLKIEFDGGTITNTELHSEQFELQESICSETELRFGCCEASVLKFKISNIFTPLKDKWLTVTETLENNTDAPFSFGKYKVLSDVPTADRKYRDVTAYDAMYDIINADVTEWYNSLAFPLSLKEFRTSFLNYFGIKQEDVELVNDAMIVTKTIQPSTISGKDVITAICEVNGCFGHIGRNGKFQYICLTRYMQGLYPADNLYPADDAYPSNPDSYKIANSFYISCQYEDFITSEITKIQIRQEENDAGLVYGNGENCYTIEDNFLVYGMGEVELSAVAENLYSVISGVMYRPFSAECAGNPCLEVGDAVRLTTKYEIVESYIFKRTLKGIQALKDTYSADGVEVYAEDVNSVTKSIVQLKGKTNTLERSVEETKSLIKDAESGLQSQITQNAESITAEVSRATTAEGELNASIKLNADSIEAEVNRATTAEGNLSSRITQTADSITSEVNRAKGAEENLSSRITQTADSIAVEVERATEVEGNLSVSIKATADEIASEVNRATTAEGNLSSRITQTADSITSEVSRATKEEGNLSSRISQTVKNITLQVNNDYTTAGIIISLQNEDGSTDTVSGTIQMTGIVSFVDLQNEGTTVINGSNIKTGTIDANQVNVVNVVAASVAAENITGEEISGKTIISEDSAGHYTKISSGIIKSTLMRLIQPSGNGFVPGIVLMNAEGNAVIGAIYMRDDITWITKPIFVGDTPNVDLASAKIVTDGRIYSGKAICPIPDNENPCGSSDHKWTQVYAGKSEINTSDANVKHDISPISEKYEKLFHLIEPCSFMFNGGDRTHLGIIAQQLKEAMDSVGVTDEELSAFCMDKKLKTVRDEAGELVEVPDLDENGNEQYTYGVRYGEFIMLNTHMLQKLYKTVEQQQSEIDSLKESVSFLMQEIERLGAGNE